MKDLYVSDLAAHENQAIVSFFAVLSRQLRSRKDGGQYLAATLADKTGKIECRMWENFTDAEFDAGDIVKVRAQVCRYNSHFQLVLEKARRAAEDEVEGADYLPSTRCNVDELWAELTRWVDSLASAPLKALLRSILEDDEIRGRFREAPAAKALHHAWLGGLLEHVVSLLGMCDAAATHYRGIHRDLLLAGAILHDIGKLEELSWSTRFEYSLRGQLLGHISIGFALVDKKIEQIPDFPPRLRLLLEHMILSHHGKLEFGSPKPPMIPEAILLHYLDDLDAKMQTVSAELTRHQALDPKPDQMTDWVRALDRQLLSTDGYLRPELEPLPAPRPEEPSDAAAPGVAEPDVAEPDVAEPGLFTPPEVSNS